MFQAILDCLPTPPVVQLFTADFERGIWKGIREVFPDCRIRGCVFHWAKAVFAKVQEKGLQVNKIAVIIIIWLIHGWKHTLQFFIDSYSLHIDDGLKHAKHFFIGRLPTEKGMTSTAVWGSWWPFPWSLRNTSYLHLRGYQLASMMDLSGRWWIMWSIHGYAVVHGPFRPGVPTINQSGQTMR